MLERYDRRGLKHTAGAEARLFTLGGAGRLFRNAPLAVLVRMGGGLLFTENFINQAAGRE